VYPQFVLKRTNARSSATPQVQAVIR
jgi:hypothetical protein